MDANAQARDAVILDAARLGLALPQPAVAGVVANVALLAEHHAALRAALDDTDAQK